MLIDFRTLFPKYGISPKGILHLGANVGEEAPVYWELGVRKQIWIEGNTDVFLKLKQNIAYNPDAVALNYVVGDENKDVVFHISNNASQSSSVLELGTHKQAHPEVHYVAHINARMQRVDELGLDLTGYDFLNVDLQGYDLKAIKGMGDLIRQFNWIYMEVNKEPLYEGCDLIDSVDLFMIANGFRRVETLWAGNTGWGDALYIR